jgi:hypothetical protein
MVVEQTDREIIIRVPKKMYSKKLQSMLDYLEFKTIISSSKASEKDLQNILVSMKKKRASKMEQLLKA